MTVARFFQRWFSDHQPTSDVHGEERTLSILVGAKALIERGWMQGGWYVLETPDGSRRPVGGESFTRRSNGTVVQACLVGGVVEAATRHSPEPMVAAPALDALWGALLTAEGRHFQPDRRVPSPAARGVQVRALTCWNDHAGRTHEEVLGLLDAAIGQVTAACSAREPDQALVGVLAR